MKHPVGEPQVEIEAQGAPLEGREGVHVNRDRMVDDLVEELLAQFDLAFPQHPIVGALGIPPEHGAVGYRRTHACFAVLVFVHQLDMSVEEPPHLVTEAGFERRPRPPLLL